MLPYFGMGIKGDMNCKHLLRVPAQIKDGNHSCDLLNFLKGKKKTQLYFYQPNYLNSTWNLNVKKINTVKVNIARFANNRYI